MLSTKLKYGTLKDADYNWIAFSEDICSIKELEEETKTEIGQTILSLHEKNLKVGYVQETFNFVSTLISIYFDNE